jgi:hypothetical protein
MVGGLERFREHFAGLEDRYVLIGGAAVDVAMDAAGLDFRVTKDLDIALLVESLDADLGRVFWDFVRAGGYDSRQKSTGRVSFYRFHSPSDPSFPAMIELFSRRLEAIGLPPDAELTPLPIGEDLSSLSAILLDDACYDFVRTNVRQVDGLPLLGPEHLIPLKAAAWLDLTTRRERGEDVDSKDIKKHRNDVVRLYQLIAPATRVELPRKIAEDLSTFLERAFNDDFKPRSVGVRGATIAEVVATLRDVYGVNR